jgi:hypothetical protein
MKRRLLNRPAQISFTSDFHELVEGDLRPGGVVTLSYDPNRMPLPPDYTFGDPRWAFTAMARFRDHGPVADVSLKGAFTRHPDRDPTGQGSMLRGTLNVPPDALFVELWSALSAPDGTHWDSDYGRNFWFRFPFQDIPVIAATVTPDNKGTAELRLDIEAEPNVDGAVVRYYDMSQRTQVIKREEALSLVGPIGAHRKWTYAETVAANAAIRFKLYYWVGGRRYKDDNSSKYYVADIPATRETIPAPPAALVAAAREWQRKLRS